MLALPTESWERFQLQIRRLESRVDCYDYLRSMTERHGYGHFVVIRFATDPETRLSRQILFTTLPGHVVRDYEEDGLGFDGRAIAESQRCAQPILWGGDNRARVLLGNDSTAARRVLDRVGVVSGITLPVQTWRSAHGLVIFGGDRRNPDIDEIARLSLVANCVFDRLIQLVTEEAPAQDFRLSTRERQCLLWTSAGKTSAEIAVILGLSEHTINQYVTSSCQKLGAVNRTQAVAKAIRVGLID